MNHLEPITLACLGELAAKEVATTQDPSLLALYNKGFEAGYSEGYAKAQKDIRMAMGCKQ